MGVSWGRARTHGGCGQGAAADELPGAEANQLWTLPAAVPCCRRLRRRSPQQQAAIDHDDLRISLPVPHSPMRCGGHWSLIHARNSSSGELGPGRMLPGALRAAAAATGAAQAGRKSRGKKMHASPVIAWQALLTRGIGHTLVGALRAAATATGAARAARATAPPWSSGWLPAARPLPAQRRTARSRRTAAHATAPACGGGRTRHGSPCQGWRMSRQTCVLERRHTGVVSVTAGATAR